MPAPVLPLLLLGGGALALLLGSKKSDASNQGGFSTSSTASFPPLPFPPAPVFTETPGVLAPDLQQMVAQAVADNSPASMTAAAFAVEAAGFPQLASELRQRATNAAKSAPLPPAPPSLFDPGMPADLGQQVAFQLQNQGDPNRLDSLAQEMRNRGFVQAADLLQSKANQIRGAFQASVAIKNIENIITSPGVVPTNTQFTPSNVTEIPLAVPVPSSPIPQPLPQEKSQQQMTAENMALNLAGVMTRAGSVKSAKGKEDVMLVKKFQGQEGLGADGKYGPGTAIRLARYIGDVPPVMYWPASANAATVKKYRSDLETLALNAEGSGNPGRAQQLRASAIREKGQGGIVGALLA